MLRDLRELSRDRTSLVAERSRLKNRIEKILEEANMKLASVASDVLGRSGRAMLNAMVQGEEDPEQLAEMAVGALRPKIPQLAEALRGRVRSVHRFRSLERIDFIDQQIDELEKKIEQQNAPFEESVTHLAEIPGLDRVTAWSVIAEIGIDMDQFPSAQHLLLCQAGSQTWPHSQTPACSHIGVSFRRGESIVPNVIARVQRSISDKRFRGHFQGPAPLSFPDGRRSRSKSESK
jgi:transposase